MSAPNLADERAREADAAARRLAQTCFDRPLVLEAGAGSGKTATLVARVLVWLLGPGWQREHRPGESAEATARRALRGVLAITFTEAAAAEMAERVGEGIRVVASGGLPTGVDSALLPDDPVLRAERALALLGALDLLEVRTIHSTCARILRACALDAGLHPAFQVDAQGEEREAVVRERVEAAMVRGLQDPPDADLLALLALGIGPEAVLEALLALLGASVDPAELEEDPFAPAELAPLLEGLRARTAAVAEALAPLAGMRRGTNLKRLFEALSGFGAALSAAQTLDEVVPSCQELLDEHGSALDNLKQGKLGKGEAELLTGGRALRALARPWVLQLRQLTELDPARARRVLAVLRPLYLEVVEALRTHGLLGFQDLLRRAAHLLRDRPEVAAQLRRSLRQVLVDEFQDTDPWQCLLVEALALDGPVEERPGLFIVGDPKQSIYGWRSADLQAYEDFVGRVLAAGGLRASLVVNFRSVPAVLRAVDQAIAPVMRPEPGRQPAFQRLVACPALAGDPGHVDLSGRAPVEIWPCWPWPPAQVQAAWADDGVPCPSPHGRRIIRAQVREIEARAVAADILALRSEGVAWREVAILFRSSGVLPTLVEALREAGIPYAVERDRSYFLRREVATATALVCAVTQPTDALALLAWLRSPAVGLPDRLLLPLWRRGLPARVAELDGPREDRLEGVRQVIDAVEAELAEEEGGAGPWQAALRALFDGVQRLARLRQSYQQEPADRFVEDLRRLSALEELEAARYLGAWRLANLDRFFRALRDGLEAGGEVHTILRQLREGLAGRREDEEGRPVEAATDAVQLMTIHKAKGLGFGHVYLVGVDGQTRADAVGLNEVIDGRAWRLLGASSPGLLRALERGQRVAQAELLRLLYVAMTRARRRLVLTGLWPACVVPVDPAEAGTFAELLGSWQGLPEDLESIALGLQAPVEDVPTAVGRLRFPGRHGAPPASPAGPGRGADPCAALPTLEQVAAQAQVLAARRRDATVRMRRPWTGAPSKLHEGEGGREFLVGGSGGDPQVAAELGRLAHLAFERLDLRASTLASAWQEAAVLALRERRQALGAEWTAALEGPSAALLDRIGGSALLHHLWQRRAQVVARELPLLAPPEGEEGPLVGLVGSVDLLLRDEERGGLCIVDFKTDDLPADRLDAGVDRHAAQLRAYGRALRLAYGLTSTPRAELWFLRADRRVEVALAEPSGP